MTTKCSACGFTREILVERREFRDFEPLPIREGLYCAHCVQTGDAEIHWIQQGGRREIRAAYTDAQIMLDEWNSRPENPAIETAILAHIYRD